MGYPMELDEYTDDAIYEEMQRRQACKRKHECYYCGKRLDSGHPCKISEHDKPVPKDFAVEFMLQGLAAEIDRRLPSRRAFTLLVARLGEPGVDDDPEAQAQYVSNISPAESARLMRGMAGHIERRERQRASTKET